MGELVPIGSGDERRMADFDEVIRLAKEVVAGEMTHEAARNELRSLADRSR